MIYKVELEGFKDQFRTINLTGSDFLSTMGNNGISKSAVMEAITVAILGYFPNDGKGKTVEATMEYTTRESFSVTIHHIDKEEKEWIIKRSFFSKGKDKKVISINGDDKKFQDGDKQIKELFGLSEKHFGIGGFLKLSDAEKKKFVIAFSPEDTVFSKEMVLLRCQVSLLTIEDLSEVFAIKMLKKEELAGVESFKDLKVDHLRAMVGLLKEGSKKSVDVFMNQMSKLWKDEMGASGNLEQIILQIKKSESPRKKSIIECNATIKKLTALKSEVDFSGTLKEKKGEKEKLETELKEVEISLGTFESDKKTIDTLKNVKKDHESKSEELSEAIEGERRNLPKLKEDYFVSILKKYVKEFEIKIEEFKKIRDTLSGQLGNVDGGIRSNEGTLKKLNENSGLCPNSKKVKCNTDFTVIIKDVESDIEIEKGVERSLKGKIFNNDCTISDTQEIIDLFALQETVEKKEKVEKKIQSLELEIKTLQGKLKDSKNLELQRTGIEMNIKEIDGQVEEMKTIKANKLIIAKSGIDLQENKEGLKLIKRAVEILGPSGLQGEIIKRIKAPLEELVNENIKHMCADMTFAISDDFKKIGIKKGNGIATFNTINKAHLAPLIAAFLTAIITRSNPNLKILLIEAGEMGEKMLRQLLAGISIMVQQGKLHNAIACHYNSIVSENGEPYQEIDGCKQQVLA